MKDFAFATPSVVSISAVCSDPAIRAAIIQSDYIRNETLRRLCALPSYNCKPLRWKNRYYEYFKRRVIDEINRGEYNL